MKFSIENDETFIDAEPEKQDIEEILIWLKDEKNHIGTSFYNNKDIIERAFKDGDSIVFKHGKKNIGLSIYSSVDKLRVNIDIFVIHPAYRGQGFGRFYYNQILRLFRSNGVKAIKLFCSPSTSEPFWKNMGFIKFSECGQTEHELTYYMILVDTASIENISMADKIELWDVEPGEADEKKSKWTWYVDMKDGVLEYPIIQPCNCNWNLRWSRNSQVLREGKVKYFTNEDFELYCYPFLYIDELKE